MSYQFVFEPEAIDDLDAIDTTTRQRIFRKINGLALNFEQAAPQGLSAKLNQEIRLALEADRDNLDYPLEIVLWDCVAGDGLNAEG